MNLPGAVRTVHPSLPVDIGLSLGILQHGGPHDPAARVGHGEAWRATRNAAGLATVRYRDVGAVVEVEAWGPGAEVELERAPAVLGLADDLAGFQPSHPLVRELHHRFDGLRMTRTCAVFEALMPAIFEQRVIGLEAKMGYRRMVAELGEAAPGPGRMIAPPAPDVVATAPYWRFHSFGLERRRAATLSSAAARAGRLEALTDLPPAEAATILKSLPGIGPWTEAEVRMSAFGDPDAVSVGDYHLPNIVSWAFTGEPRGDDARMLELLEPYRGHRGRVIRLLMAGRVGPPRRGPRPSLRRVELS